MRRALGDRNVDATRGNILTPNRPLCQAAACPSPVLSERRSLSAFLCPPPSPRCC